MRRLAMRASLPPHDEREGSDAHCSLVSCVEFVWFFCVLLLKSGLLESSVPKRACPMSFEGCGNKAITKRSAVGTLSEAGMQRMHADMPSFSGVVVYRSSLDECNLEQDCNMS